MTKNTNSKHRSTNEYTNYLVSNIDKLVRSPKIRHACEGRHPELFENTGFPPSRELRLRTI
jgi:hypothetical protein